MPSKRAPKCKIPCLRPPTFSINDYESWNLFLDLEGFVVIRNAITIEDANPETKMKGAVFYLNFS